MTDTMTDIFLIGLPTPGFDLSRSLFGPFLNSSGPDYLARLIFMRSQLGLKTTKREASILSGYAEKTVKQYWPAVSRSCVKLFELPLAGAPGLSREWEYTLAGSAEEVLMPQIRRAYAGRGCDYNGLVQHDAALVATPGYSAMTQIESSSHVAIPSAEI